MPIPKLPRLGAAARAATRAATSEAVESAFRLPTGEVVRTGPFHDITKLPGRWQSDAALEQVEPGFAAGDRFLTRSEAERMTAGGGTLEREPGLAGVLEETTPVGGHSNLWLRARAEALRRHAGGRRPDIGALVRQAESAGGFTVDLASGTSPRRGFALSVSPENEARLPRLTPEAVADYVREHGAALSEPGAHLGAWRSPEGEWYLDVSRVYEDRAEALRAARAAGQRAAYDLATGETLDVLP